MVAEVFFHKDFMGLDGTPEWSFRGAVILPGGVKRVLLKLARDSPASPLDNLASPP